MESPAVSVCMITYNQERFIRDAIEGVLMQKTDFSFELVIGEDFSTDATRALCESYAKDHPGIIRLLPSDKNHGWLPNFIRTLEACSGTYIATCDGDDYWTDPLKLQKQFDFMESNPGYVMSYHPYLVEKDGRLSHYTRPARGRDFTSDELLATPGGIATATKLFKNVFKNGNTRDLHRFAGDYRLNAYLSTFGGCKFHESIKPAVRRVHQDAVWGSKTKRSQHISKINVYVNIYRLFRENGDERRMLVRLKLLKEELEKNWPFIDSKNKIFVLNSSTARFAWKGIRLEFCYRPVTNKLKALYRRLRI